MPSSGSFLRQLSGREAAAATWRSTSKRWGAGNNNNKTYCCYSTASATEGCGCGGENIGCERRLKQMEGLNLNMYGNGNGNANGGSGGGLVMRRRVMVVVDHTSHSKHAMMWALTHVANKGDLLTLLYIIPPSRKVSERGSGSDSSCPYLANSLGALCKATKPEVEVEALVIQGPKLATVMSQVKKLEVSVLVLGQKKSSPLVSCLCGTSSSDEFVEQCINIVECLTIGVRKQSKGTGGYLISTRWQKNFWLLA